MTVDMRKIPHNRGEKHTQSKLKTADVLEIKNMLTQGVSEPSIAKKFNVSRSTISAIATKRTWWYLEA